jgi:hypothetical protein
MKGASVFSDLRKDLHKLKFTQIKTKAIVTFAHCVQHVLLKVTNITFLCIVFFSNVAKCDGHSRVYS